MASDTLKSITSCSPTCSLSPYLRHTFRTVVSAGNLIGCLFSAHHFSNPGSFFKELDRVLVKGGGSIILDPYYGWLACKIYPKIFNTEIFDKNTNKWNYENLGPMKGANQALSYVIFI